MNVDDEIQFFDELDDEESTETYLFKSRREYPSSRHPDKLSEENVRFIRRQDDSSKSFEFTYNASRHEAGWLINSLGNFYEQRWISDVLRLVRGGKEASVYVCQSGETVEDEFLAAKVFRPRQLRNLKKDHVYRTGRIDLDESGHVIKKEGELHAMAKRTAFGENLRHQSWITYEYITLQTLFATGADVPAPYASGNNAILMSYVGEEMAAAPTLNTVSLHHREARALFDRILWNIELMLANTLIHGDLSAYNVLYWEGNIKIIDFPQVVNPDLNPSAYQIFLRDVTRICDYFMGQGVDARPKTIAEQLWKKHGRYPIHEVHPKHLDADDPEDRKVWLDQQIRDK